MFSNDSAILDRTQIPWPPVEAEDVPQVGYDFDRSEFWKRIPAWSEVSREEFGDHRWQQRNCITSLEDVERVLGGLDPEIVEELRTGMERTPMKVRITPYIFSLIDWSEPFEDPVRRQFLPFGSQFQPEHPAHMDDSLGEDEDKVTQYLVHRYPDKVLFLPITICPVYCSFCTRSRLVGGSTAVKAKSPYGAARHEWDDTFDYIREHTEIEDVVISGGDAFMLRPEVIQYIGDTLLDIPHIRRFRFATKGLAVMPMKITSDDAWVTALKNVSDRGRSMMKEVCVHTHFSCENEITDFTVGAMERLVKLGIKVRNQSVLLRGVNDTFSGMYRLLKKLSFLNIQPYIVYLHDMVPGCEHLRTTLADAVRMAKQLQGSTASFNMPRFVCDAPGGGGKREITSFEDYDRELGISAWTAPKIKPGKIFYYFDPIDQLPPSGRRLWKHPMEREVRLSLFRAEVERKVRLQNVGL